MIKRLLKARGEQVPPAPDVPFTDLYAPERLSKDPFMALYTEPAAGRDSQANSKPKPGHRRRLIAAAAAAVSLAATAVAIAVPGGGEKSATSKPETRAALGNIIQDPARNIAARAIALATKYPRLVAMRRENGQIKIQASADTTYSPSHTLRTTHDIASEDNALDVVLDDKPGRALNPATVLRAEVDRYHIKVDGTADSWDNLTLTTPGAEDSKGHDHSYSARYTGGYVDSEGDVISSSLDSSNPDLYATQPGGDSKLDGSVYTASQAIDSGFGRETGVVNEVFAAIEQDLAAEAARRGIGAGQP